MTLELGSGWANSLFEWTWRTSLAASLLFLAVLAVKLLWRARLSARVHYTLSFLVFLRLLLPLTPESTLSLDNLWKEKPTLASVSVRSLQPSERIAPVPAAPLYTPVSSLPIANPKNIPWQQAILWTWFVGFISILGITALRHVLFASRIRNMSRIDDASVLQCLAECRERMRVHRQVALRESDLFQTPILFGLIHPCIVLPQWAVQKKDLQQLRSIFLHELAHVRRRDVALNWCIIVVRAWHWFNPLVWLAMRRLIEDRELLCDAIALSRMDADVRASYGHTLIEVATKRPITRVLPTASAILFHNTHIKRRIQMIARFHTNHPFSTTAAILLGLALTMSLSTRAVTDKDKPGENVQKQDRTAQGEKTSITVTSDEDKGNISPAQTLKELEEQLARKKIEAETAKNTFELLNSQEASLLSIPVAQETLRDLEKQRMAAENARLTVVSQLENVKNFQKEENGAEAISSLLNDPNLLNLLGTLYGIDQEVARKQESLGDKNPELRQEMAARKKVQDQIDGRIQGIIRSLEALKKSHEEKIALLEAQKSATKKYLVDWTSASKAVGEASREYNNLSQKVYELRQKIGQEKDGVKHP